MTTEKYLITMAGLLTAAILLAGCCTRLIFPI